MQAIETLSLVIEQTDDLILVTDGERRYSKLLFDICYDLIRNGKPGRPKKVLPKGVKVRVKNKINHIKEDLKSPNIKHQRQNIQKQNKKLKMKKYMQIMLKAKMLR
jgi:hypothetical protein